MSLLSLLCVLLLEQMRPLPYRTMVQAPLFRLADALERFFNTGERLQGVWAWCLGVGGLVIASGLVFFILNAISPLFAFIWNVLVLYLTMGFRQFSHYYTDIRLALRTGDLPRARQLLAEWRACTEAPWTAAEVARLAIEEALKSSHRHVFSVILWFVLLPGPCGAVLSRASAVFAERWALHSSVSLTGGFGAFAHQVFAFLDAWSARATAAVFAVAGDFEGAVYCWRTQAHLWQGRFGRGEVGVGEGEGIVLASGAGALGVRLGSTVAGVGGPIERVELGVSGTGEEADALFMQNAAGLVWRAVALWVVLLLLLGLASLAGN